jgi:cyclic beta-1,2-glucan synthetase
MMEKEIHQDPNAPDPATSQQEAEKIKSLVNYIRENCRKASRCGPGRYKKTPGAVSGLRDLHLNAYKAWLASAHSSLRDASRQNKDLSYATEWILDNYYIIHQAIQQIQEALPPTYFNQLPKLDSGLLKGRPRIYAVASIALSYQELLFNPPDLQTVLIQLQRSIPLTMGELWAVPIFLRYSLIESLVNILSLTIPPQEHLSLPHPLNDFPSAKRHASNRQSPSGKTGNNNLIPNIVLSLRAISEQNWNEFFESVSRIEHTLRQDPTGIYPQMDFKTRDIYRQELEKLSFSSGYEENELAQVVLRLARSKHKLSPARSGDHSSQTSRLTENNPVWSKGIGQPSIETGGIHIGEFLLGSKRPLLERRIGYRPKPAVLIHRWLFRHAGGLYLTWVILPSILLFLPVVYLAHLFNPFRIGALPFGNILWSAVMFNGMRSIQEGFIFLLAFLFIVPILTVSTSLVNWIITLLIKPRILPKLDFSEKIPAAFQSLVVIPTLIADRSDVDSLVRQLELLYLRNSVPGLRFALLTDFTDAKTENLPTDQALIQYALESIRDLNRKYHSSGAATDGETALSEADQPPICSESEDLFFFLHRRRLWNPKEGAWMGWERKRGKLHELNLLLRGGKNLSFLTPTDEMTATRNALQQVRFVISLDADTILPRGTACHLVGAMAHPLNRAVFDEKTGHVVSGYTILQPRMAIHPRSVYYSWFTRIFAGDVGFDLYSLAVSDAYQDLFGEGSYVGKGIYDVDAFERSIDNRISENTILSHDLLEGLMGRAGLATDITMIEDYPQNYFIQVMRQRRWIRGDWQLLPWLFKPNKKGFSFSWIDRWKIFDNLRRSLLTPNLFLIFFLGTIFLPNLIGVWLATILIALGVPVLTGAAAFTWHVLHGQKPGFGFRALGQSLARWLLAIAFLPYEAYISLSSALVAVYRLFIRHRHLLQWTTSASATHLFGSRTQRNAVWHKLFASTLLALILASGLQLLSRGRGQGIAASLVVSAPVLILWLFSPLIARLIDLRISQPRKALDENQVRLLRWISRRTWGFFEKFVGPEDHWLPPDHFQESPSGTIAHRTSPTNIGLLLTSTITAYHFGYLDQLGLAIRLETTLETLAQMQRFRGHFLNWYDTLTLKPLTPRYISTVDSGNLAASLIIATQTCIATKDLPILRWDLWQGYLDTLLLFNETIRSIKGIETQRIAGKIDRRITAMQAEIQAERSHPEHWYALHRKVSGPFWQEVSSDLMKMVRVGRSSFDLENLRKLEEVASQVERHHTTVQRLYSQLLPWLPLLVEPPAIFRGKDFRASLDALRATLPYYISLTGFQAKKSGALSRIDSLRNQLVKANPSSASPSNSSYPRALAHDSALKWLGKMAHAIQDAGTNSFSLIAQYDRIAASAEQYVNNMDFRFLYHPHRRVFHIGYNLDTDQLDNNFYDLLASEARIASILAIAKGDVPQTHWLQLSRPVTRIDGYYVLLSWSGTMFEYLMPSLFLRSFPGTLLADSALGAVRKQIDYARQKAIPWGISESGFFRVDASQNYQYRAFGVPGLGYKRGLGDDLVVAPYASLMAVRQDPQAVVHNLAQMIKRGVLGIYGAYESIDFTPERLPRGETSALVREYMSHHQGMILMALANFFYSDIFIRRMHSDPRIQSTELLLQEQLPRNVPLQNPYTEDVRGTQRSGGGPVEIAPWNVPVLTSIPQMHLLTNGSYSVFLSNTGSGYSTWNDVDLTRWRPDGALDPWGTWIYIKRLYTSSKRNGKLWAAGHMPIPGNPSNMRVTYFAHMAIYHREEKGIASTMEVTVAPDDPVEIRRVHLHNNNRNPATLRLTSYGEVILNSQATDARHPAFNKLFIESEFLPELNLQIFTRRPRAATEIPVFLGHMLVMEKERPATQPENDRQHFLGRGHSIVDPVALTGKTLTPTAAESTLDPIFSLAQTTTLKARESVYIAYLTFSADSREALLALTRRYRSWTQIDHAFHQSDNAIQSWLGREEISPQTFKSALQILSALTYPLKYSRAPVDVLAQNRLGQPGLWRFGMSGDYPVLLLEVDDTDQTDTIQDVLQVYRCLRKLRYKMDLVILNNQRTDYGSALKGALFRLISRMNGEEWLNQRAGIFILTDDQIMPDERILIRSAARVIIDASKGCLGEQLPAFAIPVPHLPDLPLARQPEIEEGAAVPPQTVPLAKIKGTRFGNGFGCFSADGREYIIDLPPGKLTPQPWINVIGYPSFGFLVSEAGSQCTWSLNSGENRLTPWSNDPVSDPSGEALYLRDEETGEVWTPTPLPAGSCQPYRVIHGAGYTIFEHNSHGLRQTLKLFGSPEDPVKIIHLKLENTLNRPRRITATQYVAWVLGTTRSETVPYIIPEYDPSLDCLLAKNPYNTEFNARVAFLLGSKPLHGMTADRVEFLGRNGKPRLPIALRRIGLEKRVSPGEDPCAVLQLHIDLPPGADEEIYFVLGEGDDKAHARSLVKKYHDPAHVGAAYERTRIFWDNLLDKIQIHSPHPATDLVLNRWMLYQTLSCRVWGRTGFFQSSGAYGFRDQLQDVLALLPIDPAITRQQILNAAAHQFEEGDVMHWWHPPSDLGIRSRISDDPAWLVYTTMMYVETTGDKAILEEKIPYRKASPLAEVEMERYGKYASTQKTFSLLDHCHRAMERCLTQGPNGLPLIGTGDWNDGYNRVGEKGKGESVWLAWFLCDTLKRLATILEDQGDVKTAQRYRHAMQNYAEAIETCAWDGAWYRRAYFDDGAMLGSAGNTECQIDSIAQSWAVLSGIGEAGRSRQAMRSVLDLLVRSHDRLILLFTPPFDKSPLDPGYVKGYIPGTRENGGQYTHAAIWVAWALARLGEGNQAGMVFDLLNPILQSNTERRASLYQVEPYVICADIYSMPPFVRRGGWTWYTGSAAWMYRLGLEAILGFHKIGNTLRMDPIIPTDWNKFEIRYLFGETLYTIRVRNPDHVSHGIKKSLLDGNPLEGPVVPLVSDANEHILEIEMG